MARASKPCGASGCYDVTDGGAYCRAHTPEREPWGTSTREKPKGWAKIRKRVLRRDRYRCAICGGRGDICDHLVPTKWGGNHLDVNLRTMCFKCHRAKTDHEKRLGRKINAASNTTERATLIAAFIDDWRA